MKGLERIVAMLHRLQLHDLREEYRRLFGRPAPRPRDRRDIINRIVHALETDSLVDSLDPKDEAIHG